jgi:hypothetical protein
MISYRFHQSPARVRTHQKKCLTTFLEGGIGFKNSILLSISLLQLRRKEVNEKGKGGEGT